MRTRRVAAAASENKSIDVTAGSCGGSRCRRRSCDALELCPQGAQLLAALGFSSGCCAGSAVCGSCVLSSIKRVFSFLAACGTAAICTRCPKAGGWFPHPVRTACQHASARIYTLILLYTLHALKQALVTKFGRFFHVLFTKSWSAISGGSGLSTVTVRPVLAQSPAVRMQMPSGTWRVLRHPEGLLCAVQCLPPDARPGGRRRGHPRPADGRWTQSAPGSGGCGRSPARRRPGSGRSVPLIMVYSVRLGLPSGVTHRPMMLSPLRPMGASIMPGAQAAARPPRWRNRASARFLPGAAQHRCCVAASTRPLVSLSMRFTGRNTGLRPCCSAQAA